MPGEIIGILAVIVATGVVVAAGVRRLYRPQRVVVALGFLAAAVQIWVPPCLGPGLPPDYAPAPIGHHFFHAASYEPSDSGVWIDGRQLKIDLLITAIMTGFGCVFVLAWCRTSGQPMAQDDRPTL